MGVLPAAHGILSFHPLRRDPGTRQPLLTPHFLAPGSLHGGRTGVGAILTELLVCSWCPEGYLRGCKGKQLEIGMETVPIRSALICQR